MRFLDDLDKDQKAAIVLESIIRLAKWMKLSVVSEGVETKKEWEYLRSVECDSVQGYYFYKPMPQDDFMELLDKSAATSTNLLFHSCSEEDDSILDIFNHTNTAESLLFYSMIGGMGLLEVCEDNVELIRANKGFYEALYGSAAYEHRILNIPLEEPERSLILEQCEIAKEDAKVPQFQLHHKLEDGAYVWLSVKLRLIGANARRSRFLIAVDNIDEQKRAEQERYLTNYSSVLLKLYDRVYHLDYSIDSIELIHSSGDDFIKPQTQYSFATFFEALAKVTNPDDLKKLEIIKNKPSLDETLEKEHTNCLTIHYEVSSKNAVTKTIAHFFKADLPNGSERYICCVKKNV